VSAQSNARRKPGKEKGAMMAVELQPDERETHLNMTGDNHSAWLIYSDDPYWQRRFERLGIASVEVKGGGREYRLNADMVLIRKGKRIVSEAQREALRQRAHFGGKNPSGTRVLA